MACGLFSERDGSAYKFGTVLGVATTASGFLPVSGFVVVGEALVAKFVGVVFADSEEESESEGG